MSEHSNNRFIFEIYKCNVFLWHSGLLHEHPVLVRRFCHINGVKNTFWASLLSSCFKHTEAFYGNTFKVAQETIEEVRGVVHWGTSLELSGFMFLSSSHNTAVKSHLLQTIMFPCEN